MNKVFKVIWSEARNAYVVVSEMAKSHGTKSCSTKKLLAMLIATGIMTCASVAPAMAANLAPEDYQIEAGNGASASGQGSVAIGNNAQASGLVGIAIGRDAVASGTDSIAIGSSTKANQTYSVAVGNDIGFTAYAGTAVGQQAYASGDNATAIGTMTNVDADYNASHGDWRKAGAQFTAIGAYAGSWGLASTAVGGFSKAEGKLATAIGYNSQANVDYGTALGDYSEVTAGWGVAIGASSVADRESGVVGAFAPEGADSLTWRANGGAVSVGSATLTRQITNVAAGTEATDAVNVAQLQEATQNSAWHLSAEEEITGDINSRTKINHGDTVHFRGTDDNITISKEETEDATVMHVELSRNLVIDSVQAGDFFMNNEKGIGFGGDAYITQNGLDANDKVITNVAAGTADTDAVNVGQLKNSAWKLAANGVLTEAEDVKAGDYVDFNGDQNVSVSKDAKDGVNTVKVELNKDLVDIESISNGDAKLALNGAAGTAGMINGKGASIYMQDGYTVINSKVAFDQNGKIHGVAAGINDNDAVNVGQLKAVGATANMGWNLATNGVATEATNVKPGDYVDFSGDKNISVSHDGTKVKVELNKDIDVNYVQTNALNAKYNLSVGTMAENGIMPFFVNSTGAFYAAHNKFSVDKDGKVTATAGEIGNVVLNNGVFYKNSALRDGELFIGDADGNYSQITPKSAKLGKVTIDKDGKISGVAAGAVSSTSTDAINGSQLHQTNENVAALDKRVTQNEADIAQNKADIAQNKADIATNKADIATNKANIAQNAADIKKVEALAKKHTTVAAGDNITVSDVGPNADGGKEYKVALKNNIDLGDKGSVTTGQTVMNNDGLKVGKDVSVTATAVTAGKTSISDEGVKVGDKTYISDKGLNANDQKVTNVAAGEISATSKDAVNGSQLYATNQEVANNTNRINKLGSRVNKVGAGAAALAALHPMDFDPDDKLTFSAGYGNYAGENAAAIGAYYRPDEKVMFSVAGTVGNGENMVNAGVSFALDRTNHVSNSRTALAREVIDLRGQLAVMGAKMAKMEKAFGMLDETKTKLFPDVPANHWAYEYIAKLAGNGYIEGYPDGNFGGDRLMTRYEFAAMLYRAIENGAALEEKIIKEFEPELGRIRVDRISGEDGDRDKIERVRVNDTKGERDHYGNKLAK